MSVSEIDTFSSSEQEGRSYSELPVIPIRPYPTMVFHTRRSLLELESLRQSGIEGLEMTLGMDEYQPPFHEEDLPADFDFRRIRRYNSPYIQNGHNDNGANLIPTSLSDFEMLPGFQNVFQRDFSPIPDVNNSTSSSVSSRHSDVRPTWEDRRVVAEEFIDAVYEQVMNHQARRESHDSFVPFIFNDDEVQPRNRPNHNHSALPPSYDDAVNTDFATEYMRSPIPQELTETWDRVFDRARGNFGMIEMDPDEIVIPVSEEVDNQIICRAELALLNSRSQTVRNGSFWNRMAVCQNPSSLIYFDKFSY